MRRRVGPLCFLCLRVCLPPTLANVGLPDNGRTLRENAEAFPLNGCGIFLTATGVALGLALGTFGKEGEAGLETCRGDGDGGRRFCGRGRGCDGDAGGGGGLNI